MRAEVPDFDYAPTGQQRCTVDVRRPAMRAGDAAVTGGQLAGGDGRVGVSPFAPALRQTRTSPAGPAADKVSGVSDAAEFRERGAVVVDVNLILHAHSNTIPVWYISFILGFLSFTVYILHHLH